MAKITYHIVTHDGGWGYKLGEVFSETFRSRDAALAQGGNGTTAAR